MKFKYDNNMTEMKYFKIILSFSMSFGSTLFLINILWFESQYNLYLWIISDFIDYRVEQECDQLLKKEGGSLAKHQIVNVIFENELR